MEFVCCHFKIQRSFFNNVMSKWENISVNIQEKYNLKYLFIDIFHLTFYFRYISCSQTIMYKFIITNVRQKNSITRTPPSLIFLTLYTHNVKESSKSPANFIIKNIHIYTLVNAPLQQLVTAATSVRFTVVNV